MSNNPMQACGAHCRTTGKPCRNWAMANGRCRMHGGKSTAGRWFMVDTRKQSGRSELSGWTSSVGAEGD